MVISPCLHDGRISALLDFEFARLGPADLELISIVRAMDAERRLGITRPPLLDWLQQDYPELFAVPEPHVERPVPLPGGRHHSR